MEDASTPAVRSSVAATSRSAIEATGDALTFTISIHFSSERRSNCRRMVWNSPSVVTSLGRF